MLKGDKVFLRTLEPEDANLLMLWENDASNWKVSATEIPFSLHELKEFIQNQQFFRQTGQLRFLICEASTEKPLGTIDVFQANFKHRNASIGILIAKKENREKGFAKEAITLLASYLENAFSFQNLTCSIQEGNEASVQLFESCDFKYVGKRKNWFSIKGKFTDELIYQRCLND